MPATPLLLRAWTIRPTSASLDFVAAPSIGLLPRLSAPRELFESVLHAMRSATDRTDSSGSSDTSDAANATTAARPPAQQPSVGGADDDLADAPKPAPFASSANITMEELIHEHADAVYRVALSVTRDPVLAEDASQDALIKAWQALPSFRGESPLRNWILRIAHNTAISLLRKRRDELRDPAMLPERESHFSVESQVQDRIAIQRFEQALEGLDSVSRSIVVLREVEGLSYTEMCDVLDLPMPTVKTRLLRARRQLANALEGWQP